MPRKKTNGPAGGPLALVQDGKPRTEGSAAADTLAVGACPDCPDTMRENPVLRKLWDQIAPGLFADGLVATSDLQSIELVIRHFALAIQASDDLMTEELVLWDSANDRYMKNPLEAIFRMESKAYLELAKQLGMTFVSRARTPGKDHSGKDEDNPFMPAETG